MKILFITHYVSMYGANRSLLSLINNLKKENISALVLCPKEGDLTKELKEKNIPYLIRTYENFYHDRFIGIFKIPLKVINNFLFFIKARWFKNFSPDIIYSNSSVVTIGALLSWVHHIPHVWHIREYGKPDYNLNFDFPSGVMKFFRYKANAFICISADISKKVLPYISESKKHIIHNGVVVEKDLLRNNPRNLTGTAIIKIGIIGTLNSNKNQLEAIEAFHKINKTLPSTRLQIFGEGNEDYLKALKFKVKELNLDKLVSFKGFLSDTKEIFDKLDLVLMCSQYEGMGRVTVEAMSYGIPVIGYNNGGTKELIKEGYNGFLYVNGPKELSDKSITLLSNPKAYYKMSKNCLTTVSENFTIENYSSRILNVLKSINKN